MHRKPAAHTMVWESLLQANTLHEPWHERPHQPASITPHWHSGIEELTPPQSFMGGRVQGVYKWADSRTRSPSQIRTRQGPDGSAELESPRHDFFIYP